MIGLHDAIKRFDASIRGEIVYLGLEWPSFSNLLGAWAEYRNLIENIHRPTDVDAEFRTLQRIIRLLATQPIQPRHSSLGVLDYINSRKPELPSNVAAVRDALVEALRILHGEDHVASNLEDIFSSKLNRLQLDDKTVAILKDSDFDESLYRTLTLTKARLVSFFTLSKLKRAPMADVAVIFGAPERWLYSKIDFQHRQLMISWLFSAPAALTTVVISWDGNPHFHLSNYALWPESPLPLPAMIGPVAFLREWTLPPPQPPPPPPPDPEGIDAVLVQLSGGGDIGFHRQLGPKPQIIQTDELDVSLSRTKINKLQIGNIVVFRTDDSQIAYIQESAQKKMGSKIYNKAHEISENFKSAVLNRKKEIDVVAALRNAGFTNPEYYVNVVDENRYIGPKDFKTARSIAVALGFSFSEDEFDAIHQLRIHHRQAGAEANEVIREVLSDQSLWEDQINSGRQVRVKIERIGTVGIASVDSISQTKRLVSKLGIAQHLPADGSSNVHMVGVSE